MTTGKKSTKKGNASLSKEALASADPTAVATMAIKATMDKMPKELAQQVAFSAVGLNPKQFIKVFQAASELTWRDSILKLISQPDKLKKAGYSARQICNLVLDRGFLLEPTMLEAAYKTDEQNGLDNPEKLLAEMFGSFGDPSLNRPET